ncbi:MAG: DUF790 family protein [Myxococcota bacterium]
MLTTEHIRARRRAGKLELLKLNADARAYARDLAERVLQVAEAHVGRTRGELQEAFRTLPVQAKYRKIGLGLQKLIEDRCEFASSETVDPRELRRALWEHSAKLRSDDRFDREAAFLAAAQELALEPTAIDDLMYSDLRDAQRLTQFDSLDPSKLVEAYQIGQAQAVLLRAVRVVAHVESRDPNVYRELFRKIKFRRLLYRIEPAPGGGYEITLDGPLSLFSSVTKYGIGLALVLPAIQACDRWSISADLAWGKTREPLTFFLQGRGTGAAAEAVRLPDHVQTLFERFQKLGSRWEARVAQDVLELPGVGLCVPDLEFADRETGEIVYLEVMGFWSRDAVWRRIELVEAGLPQPILFAVSARLRVSESMLDEGPSALYVYKGTMNPKLIAQHLESLVAT